MKRTSKPWNVSVVHDGNFAEESSEVDEVCTGEAGAVPERGVEWPRLALWLKIELFCRFWAVDRNVRTTVGDTAGPFFV